MSVYENVLGKGNKKNQNTQAKLKNKCQKRGKSQYISNVKLYNLLT